MLKLVFRCPLFPAVNLLSSVWVKHRDVVLFLFYKYFKAEYCVPWRLPAGTDIVLLYVSKADFAENLIQQHMRLKMEVLSTSKLRDL